jgi:hypothetical protein
MFMKVIPSAMPTSMLAGASLALSVWCAPAWAQSQALSALSLAPLASVVATASVGAAVSSAVTASAVPLALSTSGAALVVKAVEGSARGTVVVLERVSDGARASLELSGRSVTALAVGVGTVVTVSVIGTGVLLSAAGELLAFVPNEAGRALLHHEQVSP